MKRLLPTLLALVAVAVFGALWRQSVAREATARTLAQQAEARADSTARVAATLAREAAEARQAARAVDEERKAAQRAVSATRTALSTLRDSALTAARDSSVGRDSLARLVVALSDRIHADSVAQARTDSVSDVQRLALHAALRADSVAITGLERALGAARDALTAQQRIGRRGFLGTVAKLGCHVALVGAAAEVGRALKREGGAAIGGASGYLASVAVCG